MIDKQIQKAAEIIKEGGLVAFPTETVYGLGANALNPIAVAKIFELKERPSFDPLIVHIADLADLKLLTAKDEINAFRLAEKFWPGPLTLVLPKSNLVPDIVTSGLATVGIRMPNNEIALSLIRTAKCPIAAPSANKFGNLSPVKAEHVKKQLPNVDFIIDGGSSSVGIESTIVSVNGNVCTLLRPGVITLDDIERALPGTFVFNSEKSDKILAPGLLESHYSPVKPLYIFSDRFTDFPEHSGFIFHGKKNFTFQNDLVIYTSAEYNKLEIAANLFSALHKMEDNIHVKQIFIETIEEAGLGLAIMDRINKAAFKYQRQVKPS